VRSTVERYDVRSSTIVRTGPLGSYPTREGVSLWFPEWQRHLLGTHLVPPGFCQVSGCFNSHAPCIQKQGGARLPEYRQADRVCGKSKAGAGASDGYRTVTHPHHHPHHTTDPLRALLNELNVDFYIQLAACIGLRHTTLPSLP
jgi:hypothetical protein